jgi:hypothetical protein
LSSECTNVFAQQATLIFTTLQDNTALHITASMFLPQFLKFLSYI